MKRLFLLIAFLFPVLSFAQSMDEKLRLLSVDLADQIVKKGGKKVAVASLEYKDCNTEFGKLLAEEITGNLSISGKPFTVVNQKMLEALLTQNQLTAKGLIEAKNEAATLGKVSGIDALIYGTISSFGEDLRIALSIVKLPSLEVYGYAKTSVALTTSIKEMLPCIQSSPSGGPNVTSKAAGPASDCKVKNICVVCVTNKATMPIRAKILLPGYQYLFIHPNDTKCYDQVKLMNEDHRQIKLSYSTEEGRNLGWEPFVIEACNTYTKVFSK